MRRGGILWRRVLVAIVAVAATSCTSIRSTTNFKVTIRVDGRDYTSDVVGQLGTDHFASRGTMSPYGSVMTFRLPDDRVVALPPVASSRGHEITAAREDVSPSPMAGSARSSMWPSRASSDQVRPGARENAP